jgi:virginiamycin B lyase
VWGPDDKLWLKCNGVICHVDPDGGGLIDSPPGYGTVGPDGNFWSVDPAAGKVLRYTPQGLLTSFPGLPVTALYGTSMVPGPDGSMWFIYDADLFHVTMGGVITRTALPAGLGAKGPMAFGVEGDLWMNLPTGIARVTTGGRLIASYPTPAEPQKITRGPDDNLWFTYFSAGGIGRLSASGRLSDYAEKMDTASFPNLIVPAADGSLWSNAFWATIVWRIVIDPPSASTDAASGVSPAAATLHGAIDPKGGPTSAWFEWGTTTTYGQRTAPQDMGDNEGPEIAIAALGGLRASTTYHYRVVAVNGTRTVRGEDRTLTTPAAPVAPPLPPVDPPPPTAVPDADHDRYPETVDCDDHDALVHPGAVDRPGDMVDQDCSGGAAVWGHLAPSVDVRWSTQRRATRFTRLTLGALPAKAIVSLSCRGGGCGFKAYEIKVKRAVGRTDLLPGLKGSRLRRGAVVVLRLARSGQATTVIRWRIGPPTRRTTSCLAPGARVEKPCA